MSFQQVTRLLGSIVSWSIISCLQVFLLFGCNPPADLSGPPEIDALAPARPDECRLEEKGTDSDRLLAELGSENPEQRKSALKSLRREFCDCLDRKVEFKGPPEALPALVRSICDEDEDLSGLATIVIYSFGSAACRIFPELVEILADGKRPPHVRKNAARALGYLGKAGRMAFAECDASLDGTIGGFIALLEQSDREQRAFAARCLSELGVLSLPALSNALLTGGEDLCMACLEILDRMRWKAKDAAPAVAGFMKQPGLSRESFVAAVKTLSSIGGIGCFSSDELRAMLGGADNDLRAAAARLVLYHSDDKDLRTEAALKVRNYPEFNHDLKRMIREGEIDVSRIVRLLSDASAWKEALDFVMYMNVLDDAGVRAIVGLWRTGDTERRLAALEALSFARFDARSLVDSNGFETVVDEALRDQDPGIRIRAIDLKAGLFESAAEKRGFLEEQFLSDAAAVRFAALKEMLRLDLPRACGMALDLLDTPLEEGWFIILHDVWFRVFHRLQFDNQLEFLFFLIGKCNQQLRDQVLKTLSKLAGHHQVAEGVRLQIARELVKLWRLPDEGMKAQIMDTLSEMRLESVSRVEGVASIIAAGMACSDIDRRIRAVEACLATSACADPEMAKSAAGIIDGMSRSPDPAVRIRCVRLCFESACCEELGAVERSVHVRLLCDPELVVRLEAARAVFRREGLSEMDEARVLKVFEDVLRSRNPKLIDSAHECYGFGPGMPSPPIISDFARELTPLCLELLSDPSETVRVASLRSLACFGEPTYEALEAVGRFQNDPSRVVRDAADQVFRSFKARR